DKTDDLNDKLKDEVRRMDRFLQKLVEKKPALPHLTLQEVVQVAASELQSANAVLAEAKTTGNPPTKTLDVPMLTDAQEILKVDKWVALDPENALWYRGLASVPDDPAGGPFTALLAKYGQQRFITGHTPTQDRRINVRFG